jgi:ubiquitin carboxyl-terminal hydrolase 7
VAQKVGQFLNVDYLKIRFYLNPTGGDVPKAVIKRTNQLLHDIIATNYYHSLQPLFWYEVMPITIIELETKRYLKITWLDQHSREGVSDAWV